MDVAIQAWNKDGNFSPTEVLDLHYHNNSDSRTSDMCGSIRKGQSHVGLFPSLVVRNFSGGGGANPYTSLALEYLIKRISQERSVKTKEKLGKKQPLHASTYNTNDFYAVGNDDSDGTDYVSLITPRQETGMLQLGMISGAAVTVPQRFQQAYGKSDNNWGFGEKGRNLAILKDVQKTGENITLDPESNHNFLVLEFPHPSRVKNNSEIIQVIYDCLLRVRQALIFDAAKYEKTKTLGHMAGTLAGIRTKEASKFLRENTRLLRSLQTP